MSTSRPLRSVVKDRAVFQKVVYSQCWEDPEVAAEGLELGPSDDLLCLTSAGCNVMALSLRRPRSITALDFSGVQNHLFELKLAALRQLSWGDYVAFLGARPSGARVQMYRNRLRSELRDEVREYWDVQEKTLAQGVIHEGRFQKYLSTFRKRLLPLIHGKSTVAEIMSLEDPRERSQYYDQHWDNRRWRALFTVFFGRAVMARLGRDPAFFKFVENRNVGAEFLERARWAMVETNPRQNHFLQYAMLGDYPDMEWGPVYLRESNFETLRATTANVKIVRSDVEGHLSTLSAGALSKLYLSDLFEWVSPEHHEQMLRAICSVTRPGGRLIYWNLLVPRSRPESLADLLDTHEERADELHKRDLAFVYGDFHVESVR